MIDESISDEEKALIGKLVAQIDLASFAYHISQDDEFERCANAYFQRVVSSFNKYTKNEIQLFLCLHLYLLRQEMNLKTNVDRTKLIKRHLPKDQDAYFLGDTSSEKKAGRCQIMMVVNMVSEFVGKDQCCQLSLYSFTGFPIALQQSKRVGRRNQIWCSSDGQ